MGGGLILVLIAFTDVILSPSLFNSEAVSASISQRICDLLKHSQAPIVPAALPASAKTRTSLPSNDLQSKAIKSAKLIVVLPKHSEAQ